MHDDSIVQVISFRRFVLDHLFQYWISGIIYNEIFMVQESIVVKGFKYITQATKWSFEFIME